MHHFIKSDGSWHLAEVTPTVTMGALRDFARLDNPSSLVFADHGLELTTGYSTLPFGDVWVANLAAGSTAWSKISTVKAFNHSVTAADLKW